MTSQVVGILASLSLVLDGGMSSALPGIAFEAPESSPGVTSAALLTATAAAVAHAQGEDYVWVTFGETTIEGHFEVLFSDLEEKLGLEMDGDADGALDRVNAAASRAQAYIRENFSIGPVGGEAYSLEFIRQDVTELPQGTFAQFHFRIETGAPLPDSLQIQHGMFYEGDKLHRGLLLVEYNAKTDTEFPPEYTAMVFSPSNMDQVLDLTDIPGIMSPRDMIPQGVLHIWIGIDHILFLIALMLPTVLLFEQGRWRPVETFPNAFWNLLKIVTVFTVAHSLTLGLAALDLLSIPSRLVESIIALSIILVALNNISPRVREGSLIVILALGLFHGLGFASVMGHLPFRMVDLLKSVIGFNIGVELGQAAIVVVLFPILFGLRKTRIYEPIILRGVSAVLIVVAGWWFVQRAFGLG